MGELLLFWDLPTLDADIWLCIVWGDRPSGRGSKFTVMPMYWGETTLHALSLGAYHLNFILISEALAWICCNKAFCQVPPHLRQCGNFYIWSNSKTWWDEKEISSISYKLVSEEFWQFSWESLHKWTPKWFGVWHYTTLRRVRCRLLLLHSEVSHTCLLLFISKVI